MNDDLSDGRRAARGMMAAQPESAGTALSGSAERLAAEPAQSHERQTLALDALAKLTRQFSARPDFDHLVNLILMTLCGQFTVANSFAVLKRPRAQGSECAFYATGRFKANTALRSLATGIDRWNWQRTDGGVYRIRDLQHLVGSVQVISALGEADVAMICQLVHGDRVLGVIGLGRKVSGAPHTARDLGLLHSVVNTITPLIANTYLFWNMVGLNAQYLEIINSVRQGIFVFDDEYRLARVNSAGLEIVESAACAGSEPVVGLPIEQVFPDRIFKGWAKRFREAMNSSGPTLSRSLVAKYADSDRMYNVGISQSTEAPALGWTVVVTIDDVTTQVEAAHRLYDLQQVAETGSINAASTSAAPDILKQVAAGLESISSALACGDIPDASAAVASLKTLLGGQGYFAAGPSDAVETGTGMQKANLNSVITDVLSFLALQKRYKQITITPELDYTVPDTILIPDQIVLLILNLVSNAADAITDSGKPRGAIVIRTARDGGEVVLAVQDNGAGVKPSVKARLFQDQVTTKPRGRGCGLVTCRKIIDNHAGRVSVESSEGEGTTIAVRFPLEPPRRG